MEVIYGWGSSEAYLEPGGISKMKFFMKVINSLKPLTVSAKTFHHVVMTYIPSERFYLSIF